MLISIITINYNNSEGLKKTMLSVFEQTISKFEYIVIDGGSDDGSKDQLIQHENIINYWVSEPDRGIYHAMNKGIRASNGKYLLFLNSGDVLNNKSVLEKVQHDLSDDLDIYYGDLMIQRKDKPYRESYPEKLSFSYFYYKGYLPHPATFTKRSLFDKVYYFKEEFKIVADWDFLVCAICKYNASYRYLNMVITDYDTSGISSNSEYRPLLLEEKMMSLKANFPLFINDTERLVSLDNLFKSNRFQLLQRLESKKMAQKLNSIWLYGMSKIFNIKKR